MTGRRWSVGERGPEIFAGPIGGGQRSWYRIQNRAGSGQATVWIYDEIGMWGVDAVAFAGDLKALGRVDELEVHINSPGGNVFDGLAIMNMISDHPARTTAIVDGLAASAASFILQAADERVMNVGSLAMVHNAAGLAVGDAGVMREMAEFLDKASQNLATIYARRSGRPVEEWVAAMAAESWFTAEEAVEAGLADRTADGAADDDMPRNRWNLDKMFAHAGRDAAGRAKILDTVPATPASAAAPAEAVETSAAASRGEGGADEHVLVGEEGPEQGEGGSESGHTDPRPGGGTPSPASAPALSDDYVAAMVAALRDGVQAEHDLTTGYTEFAEHWDPGTVLGAFEVADQVVEPTTTGPATRPDREPTEAEVFASIREAMVWAPSS